MPAYWIKILRSDRWLNVANNDLEKLGTAKKVPKMYKVKPNSILRSSAFIRLDRNQNLRQTGNSVTNEFNVDLQPLSPPVFARTSYCGDFFSISQIRRSLINSHGMQSWLFGG